MAHYEKLVKQLGGFAVTLLIFIFGAGLAQAAVAPPLSIKSAAYNKKTASLIVKTSANGTSGLLTLLHSKGGVLGQTKNNEETFTIPLKELGEVPCQVEARLGELKISKAVAGAGAECSKVPTCKILTPANKVSTDINVPLKFEAQFALKDKKAGPLTYEWDFAGGAMKHPYQKLLKANKPILSGKVPGEATFVRDNSNYHVRFAVIDTLGRRCESSVNVIVGQSPAPADLPDSTALADMVEASQANAPAKGSALTIPAGGKVVLPYQDWTMQTATDARTVPNVYVDYGPQVNNINATVYEKARKPPVVGLSQIDLLYSAAANPADPVGPNSINSTSQNYPAGASLEQATVSKSDFFDRRVRPSDAILGDGYYSTSFMEYLVPELASAADEGYHSTQLIPPLNPEHGSYMPGKTDPYLINSPQLFSAYVEADNMFAAKMLPLTDIDDSGRVNPVPLFRIEARETGNEQTIAMTDIAVNSGRDLHCRECHAKGKMGASPLHPSDPDAPQYPVAGSHQRSLNFYEPDSDSIADQEYAAIRNIANLHMKGSSCGDGLYVWMDKGNEYLDENGNIIALSDGPRGCNTSSCHTTAISRTPYKQGLKMSSDGSGMGGMAAPLSDDMHRLHGLLQYKDDSNKEDIARTSEGLKAMLTPRDWSPKLGSTPKSLFPVKDANGKILPMEENCLKCHGGMREQCYRDRMYTAGVTCYQCHGDMLAVSNQFKKAMPSADGNTRREPWLDEPDCGSCHTGNANQGKNGNTEFFSGGVRKTAFDQLDPAATSYQPDRFNPDEIRFAVPVVSMDIGDVEYSAEGIPQPFITKTPLFRAGKDNHGQVACAACHGAAHAIWPNRDPNANDNVTSLQLQGHSGPIAECSVCHTDDSFAQRDDLDEGFRAADPMEHVLGGPHNMHPINDPNWWKGADADDTENEVSGKVKGGWHNDYAKFPGRAGEDQCAACHGNDHLGTRLSKTPVDREFVNEKGKTIKVKAGTAIGCNLCHSVIKSCTGSPNALCGKASEHVTKSTNLAPVIKMPTKRATNIVLGNDYSYAVQATDPEGDELSYQLVRSQPTDLSIDANGLITLPSSTIETLASYLWDRSLPTVLFDYQVLVKDSKGAQAAQSVKVTVDCPDGLVWDMDNHLCVKVAITSHSPISGINGEHEYTYQVIAKQRNGKPLTYSLSDYPEDMIINSSTGLIKWMAPANLTGEISFMVKATNDQGDSAQQQVSLNVCAAPLHWDVYQCFGAVNITSYLQTYGITAGDAFTYQVKATQVDNLPLTYSLTNAPAGMVIDSKTGLISWTAQATVSSYVSFTVNASDKQGNSAQQDNGVLVCAAPEHYGQNSDGNTQCVGPIQFTSTPVYGVDPGQTYTYQVTATHKNGLKLTYGLADQEGMTRPIDMSIDPQSGLITWLAQPQPVEMGSSAYFSVIATDSNGYSSSQPVSVQVCEPPNSWDEALGYGWCRGPVRITSISPVNGIDIGQTYIYQVTATNANADGFPLTFTLGSPPPGMTIDPQTGLVTWVAVEDPLYSGSGFTSFAVIATDKLMQEEVQGISLTLCFSPQHWVSEGYCQ